VRILFDHQAFSYQRYGGITRYFHELMQCLTHIPNTQVELSLRYSVNEYIRTAPGLDIQTPPRLPWLSDRAHFLASYLLDRRRSAERLKQGDYDLLHPTFYDNYFIRHCRAPYVLTIMDCIPERFPELFPRRTLYDRFVTGRWIANKRLLAKSAAHVITISESSKADIIHFYGLPPDKVDAIYLGNSLPPALLDGPDQELSPSRHVMFVGSRWGYKNFCAFVEAMRPILKQDPELSVLCVGGGRFSDSEHRLIQDAGCNGRYVQQDMDESSLANAYATAVAFVFPSLYEGFGLPIVEAFACHCACVISNASCFPEIAGDAAEYFDPLDTESMASAISRVIYDDSRRQDLIDRGAARVSRFKWESTATETLRVYERAVR
jgi:glycosyltransferase involved in cell wall biosynthesis